MLHVEEKILVAEVAKLKKEKTPAPQGEKSTNDAQGAGITGTAESAQGENPENAEATTAQASSSNWSPDRGPLYPKELLIVQQLIRYGEKIIFQEKDEEGNMETMRVAEFVTADLQQDELTLTTPLFAQLLQELMQHLDDEGFTAERYFITHANPEYSKLAADLAEDKYQLSKYHSKTQTIVNEADRLHEVVPRLLIDYKMAIVEMELKETMSQLRQPAIMGDPTLCMETMARYKQLMETRQMMAKILGDRVIEA